METIWLAGNAIPLSARLMALADVFDALHSRSDFRPNYIRRGFASKASSRSFYASASSRARSTSLRSCARLLQTSAIASMNSRCRR